VGQADAVRAETTPPRPVVVDVVARALLEDLLPIGDVTSALLPPDLRATARVVSRGDGVVSGLACATEAFAQVDPATEVVWSCRDGDDVVPGTVLGTVAGRLAPILTAERTALNFLGHLSGIATHTRRFVRAAAAGGPARIWDTRKTTPGLRLLEKGAVRAGGGANHRGNLSEWVMLKDNHLALLGLVEAVAAARQAWPAKTVHVECDTLEQVREAHAAGAGALLLDNMSPDEVRSCVAVVDAAVAAGGPPRPLLEVSGGVTLDSVADYAAAGVDCISVGGLTNSAPVLDVGLDVSADPAP
jgi:nicotinate-nucleotide pyrophosphorylase (carboxylating)